MSKVKKVEELTPVEINRDIKKAFNMITKTQNPGMRNIGTAGKQVVIEGRTGYINRIKDGFVYVEMLDNPGVIEQFTIKSAVKGYKSEKEKALVTNTAIIGPANASVGKEPKIDKGVVGLKMEKTNNNDMEKVAKFADFLEEAKKPSEGLTKKEKSSVVKKAKKGGDIGKPGKNFDEVAAKASKQYGSEEKGKKVAAAAMWKNIKRHESIEIKPINEWTGYDTTWIRDAVMDYSEVDLYIHEAFDEFVDTILKEEDLSLEDIDQDTLDELRSDYARLAFDDLVAEVENKLDISDVIHNALRDGDIFWGANSDLEKRLDEIAEEIRAGKEKGEETPAPVKTPEEQERIRKDFKNQEDTSTFDNFQYVPKFKR